MRFPARSAAVPPGPSVTRDHAGQRLPRGRQALAGGLWATGRNVAMAVRGRGDGLGQGADEYSLPVSAAAAGAPRRGARRVAYFRRALADFPAGLSQATERRLVAQLSAATGIEALVAMTDIAGLARDEVPEVGAEMVAAILDRHLA